MANPISSVTGSIRSFACRFEPIGKLCNKHKVEVRQIDGESLSKCNNKTEIKNRIQGFIFGFDITNFVYDDKRYDF